MAGDLFNNTQVDRTLLCRYEMKYVISESRAAAVARFVEPYLKLDHFSRLQPTGFYPVVSLYLDSDDMKLCKESLHGVLNRFKLRVRSYTDDTSYPRFFEIKRRANTVIIKSRAKVNTQDVPTLLSGRYVPPVHNYKTDVDALRQFQLYMKNVGAKPLILIRYLRRAYEGDSENRVRVTFDRKLCYKVTNIPDIALNGNGWQPHPVSVNTVILEIKFTGRYPAWLGRMTEHFGLGARSMSKFATSIQTACDLRFCGPKLAIGVW